MAREHNRSIDCQTPHLVGTSFGGVIAQTFAINYPYRVKSLMLIATASAADEDIRTRLLSEMGSTR